MEPDGLPADEFDEPEEGDRRSWLGSLSPKAHSAFMGRTTPHPELGEILLKGYESVVEKDDADNGRLQFSISTETEDRAGDTIALDGWNFKNYSRNPVVLFDHEYGEVAGSPPSQGKTLDLRIDAKSKGGSTVRMLRAAMQFHRKTKFNEELYQMYRGGYMQATSVGFWPLERPEERETSRGGTGFAFTKQELLEWSLVAVPMNAEAYQLAASKGIIRARTAEYLKSIWSALGDADPQEHAKLLRDEQRRRLARELVGEVALASLKVGGIRT